MKKCIYIFKGKKIDKNSEIKFKNNKYNQLFEVLSL